MRDSIFIVVAIAVVWLTVFVALPSMGFPLATRDLLASASVSAVVAGLLVLLGETIVENIILVFIVFVLSGILAAVTLGFDFVFVCAIFSAVIGVPMNLINRALANKRHDH